MSEVPKIIEDFLKGNNDAGGTISSLEEEASRLASQIEVLENVRDTAYNAALEWAANWIIGAQLSGHGVEVQRYANTMAMSIRAAKRGLTKRAADELACDDIYHDFLLQWEEVNFCDVCGTPIRR